MYLVVCALRGYTDEAEIRLDKAADPQCQPGVDLVSDAWMPGAARLHRRGCIRFQPGAEIVAWKVGRRLHIRHEQGSRIVRLPPGTGRDGKSR